MEFKIGDRVVCDNPKDDHSGHHLEWVGVTGTIVGNRLDHDIYNVRFDTIPAHYSVPHNDIWFRNANELSLIDDYFCNSVEVSDLI